MAMSDRRKHLVNRIAALVKNLEDAPENFTMDKVLDRMVAQIEKNFRHRADVLKYRGVEAPSKSKPKAKPKAKEEAPVAEGGE